LGVINILRDIISSTYAIWNEKYREELERESNLLKRVDFVFKPDERRLELQTATLGALADSSFH